MNLPSAKELLSKIESSGATKIKLAVADIDGILRGKVISLDKFKSIAEKGFGFCDVIFGWDSSDLAYNNANITGWHTGYPDATANIALESFRKIPWENNLPFFLADFSSNTKMEAICPRSLLKRIIAQASHDGYTCFFSQEFEWFNFKKLSDSERSGAAKHAHLSEGMFGYSLLRASQHSGYFNDLFDLLLQFGIPLEGLHTETGPGVYEAAILFSEILEAADRAILFKTAVKEIASRHEILPTFMAKIDEKLPGCSGHVHQSLWSADKSTNLFFDQKSESGISKLMEQYIAGQLYCLPFILPMFAPTVNSYKRLVEGAWAPTTVTWGIDNRTVALRALPGNASSTRLETRVVGSDSNPYLAMAACLASGLYGIRNKLSLSVSPTNGNGYTNKSNGVLPADLWQATQQMKVSPVAIELFGEAFTEHFCATREWEWRQFAKAVTDWEMQRYMEII